MILTNNQITALRKNNGGTFGVWYPDNQLIPNTVLVSVEDYFSNGYFVAEDSATLPIPDRYIEDKIIQTQIENAARRAFSYDQFMGFWLDKGHWYIDYVVWIEHFDDAVDCALVHNQLAIWDIANKKDIRLHE
jgi:hypothetical protein